LSGQDVLLSKIDRDDIERALQSLQINVLSAEKNKSVKELLRQVRHIVTVTIKLSKWPSCVEMELFAVWGYNNFMIAL